MTTTPDRLEHARALFRNHGGILRTMEAIRLGIHPRTLYEMRDSGNLEKLARGVYRLAEYPVLKDPDLATVALKVRNGVICLLSALSIHEITTQIPHQVYVAVRRGTTKPRLEHPPIRVFWFSQSAFVAGIETHIRDGIQIRVYGPEKTLADCFKYRNKIGMDTVIEALRLYRQRKPFRVDELIRFGRVCRVEKVMKPYLEVLI
jgi:predicted transcriptional regulator of viral defense system